MLRKSSRYILVPVFSVNIILLCMYPKSVGHLSHNLYYWTCSVKHVLFWWVFVDDIYDNVVGYSIKKAFSINSHHVKCVQIRTRKTPYLDTFHAVYMQTSQIHKHVQAQEKNNGTKVKNLWCVARFGTICTI